MPSIRGCESMRFATMYSTIKGMKWMIWTLIFAARWYNNVPICCSDPPFFMAWTRTKKQVISCTEYMKRRICSSSVKTMSSHCTVYSLSSCAVLQFRLILLIMMYRMCVCGCVYVCVCVCVQINARYLWVINVMYWLQLWYNSK